MNHETTTEQALEEIEKRHEESAKIIQDKNKLDEFLQALEEKLKVIPKIGDKLSHIPVFAQLIKDYATKKYTKIPMGSLIAIVSALSYLILPFDLISDLIPGIGYFDDAAVIGACLLLVDSDIKDYLEWRENNINAVSDENQ